MPGKLLQFLTLVLGISCIQAQAETVFVIDRLLVGVHKEKALDSEILKVFPTGTQLEVLERIDDLAKIKGPEDITGWVDASYLTSKKPALVLLEETRAELERLKRETPPPDSQLEEDNERLKQQAASERLKAAELQAQLSRLQNHLEQSDDENDVELSDLQAQNRHLLATLQQQQTNSLARYADIGRHLLNDVQNLYYLLALLLCFVLAFLCGLQFMDWLQRRRHGGFRI